jgi:hypothetical protein
MRNFLLSTSKKTTVEISNVNAKLYCFPTPPYFRGGWGEAQKKSTSVETGAFEQYKDLYYFFFPFAGPAFAAFAAS